MPVSQRVGVVSVTVDGKKLDVIAASCRASMPMGRDPGLEGGVGDYSEVPAVPNIRAAIRVAIQLVSDEDNGDE